MAGNGGYDAIIVGARCAGAPVAMLLAQKGHRVLLVDRATFPSDTVSTHVVHPRAVATLARWNLLGRLQATGCPPIDTYSFDFGPFTLAGAPGTVESPVAYCPRRTVLDKLLVDAAAEAGAEVREGFTVEEVLLEDGAAVGVRGHAKGGPLETERGRFVIGADGRHSLVAAGVHAEKYDETPPLLALYYGYWSGLPMAGRFETYIRPRRGFAAAETHDGLTVVPAGWPHAEFEANKKDYERHYRETLEGVPAFAARLRKAKLETRLSAAALPGFFRKPFGPGWVLIGDAGYLKDPITAQGIMDAFDDAERCAQALDDVLRGARSLDEAMGAAQQARDAAVQPMYEMTCQLATLEPPPPPMQQLFAAIRGNQPAMDAFARMNAGTISPAAFMDPANIASMLAAGRAETSPAP